MKDINEQLREAIRESGLSLNQLWKDSGVQASALSRFMRDERGLSGDAIAKVCKVLGLALAPCKARKQQ